MSLGRVAVQLARRKPYPKPELTQVGSVGHSTRGSNGFNQDIAEPTDDKVGTDPDQGLG